MCPAKWSIFEFIPRQKVLDAVVSYVKPPEVLAAEAEDLAQRKAMANKENGDVDCKQQ